MNYKVWSLYHCPCATETLFLICEKMKINVSVVIVSHFAASKEDFIYEMLSLKNFLLITWFLVKNTWLCLLFLILTFVLIFIVGVNLGL